jgi:hypothetical protein
MAENIVNNLFGIDPAALQQQRAATDFANAFRFAQLDPLQRANLSIYQGSAGLGRAANQLLGGDEQLNRATKVRELSSQFDMTSADGLRQFAQAVAPFAPDVAQQAVRRADEIVTTGLKQAESIATTQAKLREKTLPTSNLGKLVTERDALIASGLPANDPRILAYNKAIDAEGEGKAPKVSLDLGGLTTLFAKKEAEAGGKNVADQITKAQDALAANSKVSRDIAEVERILPNAFTGQFANFSKTASKTLSGLGIPVSEKASNTETLNALFTNFVLPAVRQLPGSLAAKELDFLRQSKPEALQEPATIKKLVALLKDDISANRALVKRADEYRKADKFGSLQDFNIALQQDSIYQDLTKYRQLESRVRAGQKVTKEEADFAKKIEKDLGL